ncbi:unnamed protein product [Nezara viridula]|uniref:Uncharacterized protein n=1 Tax=Nezara viridula TaxID=85310 RepID=A0A9P0H1T0_NEZVI|nr:unnamed protein product [Nezara viridula]
MDDSREVEALKEPAEEEYEGESEEQIEEQERLSDGFYSYCSTDSTFDQPEYKHLLHEPPENMFEIQAPERVILSDDEEEMQKSESGTIHILSEQTEISDESAWYKDVQKPPEKEVSFVEKLTDVSSEHFKDNKVEEEEYSSEQISAELEEMEEEDEEEEEEEEEEQLESEMDEEYEKERKVAQFQRELEEVLSYEFPENVNEEEGMQVLLYENMLKELEKEDKEIDVMLTELDKSEKTIHIIERTLGPLITHYEKEISAFRKVGADSFADFEGEEEEEDVEDEYKSRAAEMAKEILEANDIESVGSLGKESSGDDLSNMLSQMALDLKDSEPEVEKEEQPGSKKAQVGKRRKTVQSRRASKPKIETKKKKK